MVGDYSGNCIYGRVMMEKLHLNALERVNVYVSKYYGSILGICGMLYQTKGTVVFLLKVS